MATALAASITCSTSPCVTSLSRTPTTPWELRLRTWLPAMPANTEWISQPAISSASSTARWMAGCEIHSVFAGIAGSHVRSLNSHGVVGVRDKEVTQGDVEHVIDAAKAVAIPADQKILHVLPQEFLVDGQEGIRDPIGMSGVRLEAKVHIVTGADSAAQNIEKCI